MKVIKSGTFLFVDGTVRVQGWIFDGEGVRYPSMAEQKLDSCRAILAYLAEGLGVEAPCTGGEQLTLESERAALDAIATVRWPLCGD